MGAPFHIYFDEACFRMFITRFTPFCITIKVQHHVFVFLSALDCPPCYSLVQERVYILRRKIRELEIMIRRIIENPPELNDTDFRAKIIAVNITVYELWLDATNASPGGGSDC